MRNGCKSHGLKISSDEFAVSLSPRLSFSSRFPRCRLSRSSLLSVTTTTTTLSRAQQRTAIYVKGGGGGNHATKVYDE